MLSSGFAQEETRACTCFCNSDNAVADVVRVKSRTHGQKRSCTEGKRRTDRQKRCRTEKGTGIQGGTGKQYDKKRITLEVIKIKSSRVKKVCNRKKKGGRKKTTRSKRTCSKAKTRGRKRKKGDGDGDKQSELVNKKALDAKRRVEVNEEQTTHEQVHTLGVRSVSVIFCLCPPTFKCNLPIITLTK